MASLANPRLNWADDGYDDAPSPAPPQPVASAAAESGEGTSTPPSVTGISLLVAAPSAEPGGAGASAGDVASPGGGLQVEEKQYGKRVVDVDAETDRMARLFLGKEDEEQAKLRLKIVQANPNSHLCSAKTFDEMQLPPHLLKGVQHMGFEKPSVIQETALPICLRNPPENLLAQAQSGSGKTAAFCLAGLYRVDTRLAMPQMLIVTPTRELAVQCFQETLLPMSKFMDPPLTVFMSLKGTRAPSSGIVDHVVVGTPGSLIAALKHRKLILDYVNVFVLDEADAMLEAPLGAQGSHRENCITIKRRLPPRRHQTLLFSATFPSDVKQFGLEIAEAPVNEITLPDEKDLVLEVITQLWIDLRRKRESRLEMLQELYEILEMGQSIIFCRTREDADRITNSLNEKGFMCSNLHGDLLGEERDACMRAFREGLNKVLITTNVLARGVDVPAVSLVVNYDMPTLGSSIDPDPDTYLHRIGRTGRFGRRGVAINLIQDEVSYRVLQSIDRHFSPGSSMVREATTDVEDLEKIIVEESRKRVAVLDPLTGFN